MFIAEVLGTPSNAMPEKQVSRASPDGGPVFGFLGLLTPLKCTSDVIRVSQSGAPK